MLTTLLTTSLLLLILTTPTLCTNVWTVNCAPLTQQRSDPILTPNLPSSHVHAIVGSTAFTRHMPSPSSAAAGKATTCDKATDHSNYWSPSLYQITPNGEFKLLPFTGMVAYYTNYTCSYSPSSPSYCTGVRDAIAPPQGLRMIAGDSAQRTLDKSDIWQAAILMETGNDGEVYGLPTRLDGTRLSGHARFPSCWDGRNLDSADHRSHVAYPDPELGGDTQGGMCPATHPVALVNIGAEFGFELEGITDPAKVVFANGDTTGYGFHADFLAGWQDPDALTQSFANCRSDDDCPWRSFGSPDGEEPHPTARVLDTPPPQADIGQNGPVAKLPGNNPVRRHLAIIGRRMML